MIDLWVQSTSPRPRSSSGFVPWLGAMLVLLSGCLVFGGERTIETHGTVIWKGSIKESKGNANVGMHASSSYHVVEDGLKVQVDGQSEPLLYTARSGASWLQEIAVGDRVRVSVWEHPTLFGHKTDIVGISKAKDVP